MSLIPGAARIVRMQDADVATVATLEAEVSPAPWSPGIFSDCLRAEYECWVVRADKVFGFAILSLAPGEAHLLNIAIAPDRQGQGFGRELLRKAANTAKNEGAERIYERAGFEFLSLRVKYYGPPKKEDAFVYTLAL